MAPRKAKKAPRKGKKKPAKPTGRPLTIEARAPYILAAIADGHLRETSAAAGRVGLSTLRGWLEQGRDDRAQGQRTTFSAFLDAVEEAEAIARLNHEARVLSATKVSPEWSLRWLRIKHPDVYVERTATKVEHSGAVDTSGGLERFMSTEQLEQIYRIQREALEAKRRSEDAGKEAPQR